MAKSHLGIGNVYNRQGRYEDVRVLLAVTAWPYGQEHPECLLVLNKRLFVSTRIYDAFLLFKYALNFTGCPEMMLVVVSSGDQIPAS